MRPQLILITVPLLLILAVVVVTKPAIGVQLTHPDSQIFKACAEDMNVAPETVADRILATGWVEVGFTNELQNLGREYDLLRSFSDSVYFGDQTQEEWDISLSEVRVCCFD